MTLDPHNNLTVVYPEDAVISCLASGLPRPTVTWWTLGGQLTNSSEFRISSESLAGDRQVMRNLTVVWATPNDAATYTCRAENIVDSVEENVELIVHGESHGPLLYV